MLLVEDNFLLAREIQSVLERLGCYVTGPASSVEDGMELAENAQVHMAVLDVTLGTKDCSPVAEVLQSRGIPFIFVTGHSESFADGSWREIPLVSKPITEDGLVKALSSLRIDDPQSS